MWRDVAAVPPRQSRRSPSVGYLQEDMSLSLKSFTKLLVGAVGRLPIVSAIAWHRRFMGVSPKYPGRMSSLAMAGTGFIRLIALTALTPADAYPLRSCTLATPLAFTPIAMEGRSPAYCGAR